MAKNESQKIPEALLGTGDVDVIQTSLDYVREHFDMDIAYLSEFIDDNLVFRRVSAADGTAAVAVGDVVPLDQVYCPHILAGRLPELIPDTAEQPVAQTIDITKDFPIGSHLSIPILRSDGSNYGMFCCLSSQAQPSLNARDHAVMRAFARLASDAINEKLSEHAKHTEIEVRVRAAIENDTFSVVYQPIVDGVNSTIKGFEALCRFDSDPYMSPDIWFLDAGLVDLQTELEIFVIKKALHALTVLPDHIYLSLNASPATVQSGQLNDVFAGWDLNRIVLELTEHEEVPDYDALTHEIDLLRSSGVRLAIDDVGAGYAALRQIVKLRPDIIKLDMFLTSSIDSDVVRKSLSTALQLFARDTESLIVAEGVETEAERATLTSLNVDMMQGFLLGRPVPIEDAIALCMSSTDAKSFERQL